MFGHGGLFRQENVEKRRVMSMREWAELCAKEELRAPGVDDVGLHARANAGGRTRRRTRRSAKRESETAEPDREAHAIKEEEEEAGDSVVHDGAAEHSLASPPNSIAGPLSPAAEQHTTEAQTSAEGAHSRDATGVPDDGQDEQPRDDTVAPEDTVGRHEEEEEEEEASGSKKPKGKRKRTNQSRQAREASLAERAAKDKDFLESFDPHSDWLPPNTTPFDYTPDFCRELERRYWRNCGLGKPAWYGADMQGAWQWLCVLCVNLSAGDRLAFHG